VEADARKKIQLVLILAMTIAAIRVGWIFYERHQEAQAPAKKEAPPLNPDYYVTPKKVYAYDLKTAKKELTGQHAWVKVGYYYPYYPASANHAELTHEAGKLGPLEEFQISDVFLEAAPDKPGQRKILALFHKSGRAYATPLGTEQNGDFKFYCNDMLFFEDPHQLYKHWPPEVWQTIDQRQVKPGMSELQTDFAIGVGLLESGADENDKTLDYPNAGKPLVVSYHNGKVIEIKPGKSE
jgi:hypothetical protein